MQAIIIEEDYKGSYKRFALTKEEFLNAYGRDIFENNMQPPSESGQSHTLKPMVHIWYKTVDVGDSDWMAFFTDMTWGLSETDEENNEQAYIDYDACQSLRECISRLIKQVNPNDLTTDECLEIFKRYDKTCYDYYVNNMWFFGYSARNYAAYLKEKFSDDKMQPTP